MKRAPARHAPAVVAAYLLYDARSLRLAHPAGQVDAAGRWYPADTERQACCAAIRPPSRGFPLSLNRHCRSLVHVAHLSGVPVRELRSLSARMAWERMPAATAPRDLCLVCGASWRCEHQPVDARTDPALMPVPAHRARMERHLALPA